MGGRTHAGGGVPALDRALYALFSGLADSDRHARDRRRYRGANLAVSFELYLARVYGIAVAASLLAFATTVAVGLQLPAETVAAAVAVGKSLLPVAAGPVPDLPRRYVATAGGVVAAAACGWGTLTAGRQYLALRARARRDDIQRTLPSAVRYLRTLADGSDDPREMLSKVAENEEAYGETAVAFRRVLNKAALSGSLGEALGLLARDTPSREALAPFLLKFREHAEQGPEELATYLRMEGRTLGRRRARARERASDFLELVAELFVVLLVLPALLVIVVTVMSVLSPGLSAPIATPVGTTTWRAVVVQASVGFVLVVGAATSALVEALRPAGLSMRQYRRPAGVGALLWTTATNPTSGALTLAPFGLAATVVGLAAGTRPGVAVLLGYGLYGVGVGLVGVRRARRDDAKDRELADFVHAVAGHVSLGRPFPAAVEAVAEEVDLGPLNEHVADLAFTANLAGAPNEGVEARAAALEQFVEGVGTPLARQAMGLVTGALSVGSDADEVFEALQTEVGRLHHEKQALRSSMQVYVAVGWTTALLVVGVVVAVDAYVLAGFAQLGSVGASTGGLVIDPGAVQPDREGYRFYLVCQATMLACGWFAGTASGSRYEALLHSGALVLVAHLVFAGAGIV
jgi:archaellum biogenesis protein FlaJ (TadC family)